MQTDVLIVGAGPVGLALAIELGSRGVRCVVVEQHDRVGVAPRAKTTNVRTREHLRRWGIADKLAAASPLGVDYPANVVFATRLNGGFELCRFENNSYCGREGTRSTRSTASGSRSTSSRRCSRRTPSRCRAWRSASAAGWSRSARRASMRASGLTAEAQEYIATRNRIGPPLRAFGAARESAAVRASRGVHRRPGEGGRAGIERLHPAVPHTSRAVSTTSRSLATSCSIVIVLPPMPLSKPHCGLSASCSSGAKRAASSMRRFSSSFDLELRALGGDEAEHRDLALGQEAQRLEAARALGVVFEEIAVDVDLVEQQFGDRLVAAFRDPGAGEIAAAEMHAHRHVGRPAARSCR